jgi:two-component system, OmpR family, KDP operon response regulator KdpE
MARVALIEDDAAIRTSLTRDLAVRGHVVSTAVTGLEGLSSVIDGKPDVVLLDLGLPDVDGRDVLAMLRGVSDVPVIVTTARDDDASLVALLDAGADDYVVKPFTAIQVDARIRALLRRSRNSADDDREQAIVVGGLSIDPVSREATLDGGRLELTRKEFDLLAALARRPGEVVTKRELLADVWQLPWGGGDRTVDVHLSWLRRKLGETAASPRYLFSVRGVGVKLVAPKATD